MPAQAKKKGLRSRPAEFFRAVGPAPSTVLAVGGLKASSSTLDAARYLVGPFGNARVERVAASLDELVASAKRSAPGRRSKRLG